MINNGLCDFISQVHAYVSYFLSAISGLHCVMKTFGAGGVLEWSADNDKYSHQFNGQLPPCLFLLFKGWMSLLLHSQQC